MRCLAFCKRLSKFGNEKENKMKKSILCMIMAVMMMAMLLVGCSNESATSSSTSTTADATTAAAETKSNTSSSSSSSAGKCKYKVGDQYVCSKSATNGNFCKEHYDYLNDVYNSLMSK